MELVGKIHGIPRSLVSDRDPLFVSKFWQELFRLSEMQLRMSLAYHPQSDGQTKVLNRVIQQYLCAFVHYRPRAWGKLLLGVERSHNTSWNARTGSTPYEITFGRKPFNFLEYILGSSNLDVVEDMLTDREETFQAIRKKLMKAQATMKHLADAERREVTYQTKDWVSNCDLTAKFRLRIHKLCLANWLSDFMTLFKLWNTLALSLIAYNIPKELAYTLSFIARC